MSNELWHVCSLVVQARPEAIPEVIRELESWPGTEVAVSEQKEGKLVVVMQDDDTGVLLDRIESARNVAGVLAVSLVYHQQDEQGEDTP
ncbi:chaperone NapD [Enterobacillus tribolii]|uniref:Chaperone NapD n=1 Tax=Enterobacillus tribolii TaxID=1487935 RepID=A0A370QSV7_9GAMM|nr:chaperone NapD [Enterobacillus tribolii]MBW7983518.1 chaperone NapD [Enterobacillus tribolii]RDK91983.1 periplasmic nitrate reductase chaperone NapD [Enterobacillus tribolii]